MRQSGICVIQRMEACQIYPFSLCGMFGGGGSAEQFCEVLMFGTLLKNPGKPIHLFVWEKREYLTKQHS